MTAILVISWVMTVGSSTAGPVYTIMETPSMVACRRMAKELTKPGQRASCFELKAPPDPMGQLRKGVKTT